MNRPHPKRYGAGFDVSVDPKTKPLLRGALCAISARRPKVLDRNHPRHEPGRYLTGTGPAAPGPHTNAKTCVGMLAMTKGAFAASTGVRRSVPPAAVPRRVSADS